MDALRPFAFAVLDLLDLVGSIDHRKRRLNLVTCIGDETLLLLIAFDHGTHDELRKHDDQRENGQPTDQADNDAHRQKRMKVRKLARTIEKHIERRAILVRFA